MVDAAPFIGWGAAVAGRAGQALQLFGAPPAGGGVASSEPVQLDPHGDLAGFVLIQGTVRS